MKLWLCLFKYLSIYGRIAVIMSRIKSVNSCVLRSDTDGGIRCCYNYVEVNGVCENCRPCYFGVNCKSRCYGLAYGFLCSLTCDCSALDCDYVYGCPNSTEASFTSSAFTVKVEENTTQKGFGNDTSSELDMHPITIIKPFGTLISLVLILMIIREVWKYRKCLGLHSMNDVSCRIHEVNDIYTEINEVIVIEGFPKDNDNTGSKEYIGNGHTPLSEMGEDRYEKDVYSTACKERYICKDKVKDDGKREMASKRSINFEMDGTSKDKRETVNNETLYGHSFVDIVQNCKGKTQWLSFDLQNYMKSITLNCSDVDDEDECSDNIYVNDKTESTYL
ncbi:uncharacterized protein LOC130048200 [Ostrea edulis]|uniref:uncharacterized protein LOC130048200 n=1 Tax=Ostrea edulis TaxID=37623 RepID=UPI0024AFE7C3|nr:uncharacterized protein LOC130048200 [Ostrea edulis]